VRRLLIASVVCVAALAVGATGAAHAVRIKGVGKILKARIYTDGVMTVGQLETVQLAKLPPKVKFDVGLAPTLGTGGCDRDVHICSSDIRPAPGTPPFRSSGKGRAQVSFVVPSTYDIFTLKRPISHPDQTATFVNGQGVRVATLAIRWRHHKLTLATGTTSAVIEVPPPPPAP
jgi:hypothetical protein